MKAPYLVICVVLAASLAACTTHYVGETSTSTLTQWGQRNIDELIDVIGPFDTTTIKGDSRSYYWYRFSRCRLTAKTNLDNKIQVIELEETGQGCDAYRQRLGG